MSVGRKEVLVASDVASANKKIKESLKGSGYEIHVYKSAEACLEDISEASPALVFLSLFSEFDGADLLAQVRKAEPELPIILLADDATAEKIVPLMVQGGNDYLLFPIADPSLVEFCVKRNLERRKEVRRRKRGERDLKRLNKALLASLKVLEQDQQAGLRVQQGMMPESPYRAGDLVLTHKIVPSLILSGDFIDYFELPDRRLIFYIADVSGHGTSGAIVTVLLKSLSTRLFNESEELGLRDAGEIIEWFNRELLGYGLPQHVTMFLGIMDRHGRTLEYANAAHFPASILSDAESTRYLEIGGLPLGIYDTATYSSRQVQLPASFELVMFSDGVFEIMPEASLSVKESRLLKLVESANGNLERLAEKLGLGEVTEVPDDIAVFTVAKAG